MSDIPVGQVELSSHCSGTTSVAANGKTCYWRGKPGHTAQYCSFRQAKCHKRGKKGHLARVCRNSGKRSPPRAVPRKSTHVVDVDTTGRDKEGITDIIGVLHRLGPKAIRPYKAVLRLNGQSLSMEIDTGATVSIVSEETQKKHFPSVPLHKANICLRTYSSEPIAVVGLMKVEVQYRDYRGTLELYVCGEGKWSSSVRSRLA